MIREGQRLIAERFGIHAEAIRELANEPNRHAVDKLILNYVTDFRTTRERYAVSVQLLEGLIEDSDFRRNFLTDRVYQYEYLQRAEGQWIDPPLNHALVRDRVMRARLIESESVSTDQVIGELTDLLDRYRAKLETLSEWDAAAFFLQLYEASADKPEQFTQHLRSSMALDQLSVLPEEPMTLEIEQLALMPPAVILWQANRQAETAPENAITLYELIVSRYPFSDSALDALSALAERFYLSAFETGERDAWQHALAYSEQLVERTTANSPSAEPLLRTAEILTALDREDEAIAILGKVLKTPSWRGLDHAKAHLALGKLYLNQEQWEEAHGFFERLIVAYGGYLETVSWAYYYDLKALEALDASESVEQLLAEYRTRLDVLGATEAYIRIKEAYDL